ncbi:MAG: hypothetical protein DMF09_03820, partial [Verrucomicrobia bacterium]
RTRGHFAATAKYSKASRIFYGRFLRFEDFFEQGYAIRHNTLQMVNYQTRRRCLPCNPHVDVFAHFCVGHQRRHNRFGSSA